MDFISAEFSCIQANYLICSNGEYFQSSCASEIRYIVYSVCEETFFTYNVTVPSLTKERTFLSSKYAFHDIRRR